MDANAQDTEEPSAAAALSFGVVTLGLLGVVALIVALFVAHPATTAAASAAAPTPETTPTTAAASSGTSIGISLKEYSVGVSATTLTPGIKTLQITNDGTIPHELLAFRSDLAPSAYPIDPATGDISEDGPGISKVSDGDNLDPNGNQVRSIDLSQPGTYTFICNLRGHFKAGMVTTITVAPNAPNAAITLNDYKIGTGTTEFTAGTYGLSVANGGPSVHELLVFQTDLDPADFPKNADGSVQEDGAGVSKISDGDNIDPGKLQARTVDLTQPGHYVLICNLPGHFQAGMYATINVSP